MKTPTHLAINYLILQRPGIDRRLHRAFLLDAVLHSTLSLLGMLALSFLARRYQTRVDAFIAGCFCRSLVDIYTHVDAGPLMLWPFDWYLHFTSIVSHWDVNCGGSLVMTVEMTILVIAVLVMVFKHYRQITWLKATVLLFARCYKPGKESGGEIFREHFYDSAHLHLMTKPVFYEMKKLIEKVAEIPVEIAGSVSVSPKKFASEDARGVIVGRNLTTRQ